MSGASDAGARRVRPPLGVPRRARALPTRAPCRRARSAPSHRRREERAGARAVAPAGRGERTPPAAKPPSRRAAVTRPVARSARSARRSQIDQSVDQPRSATTLIVASQPSVLSRIPRTGHPSRVTTSTTVLPTPDPRRVGYSSSSSTPGISCRTSPRTGSPRSWAPASSPTRPRACPCSSRACGSSARRLGHRQRVLLVALTVATVLHWVFTATTARQHHLNPVISHFYGAPRWRSSPSAPALSCSARTSSACPAAVGIDWVLWSLGTAMGLVTAIAVPYLTFTRHETKPDVRSGGG